MKHLTESEIARELKYNPDLTIRGYIDLCREIEMETAAIARTVVPIQVADRLFYTEAGLNAGETIWNKINSL